VIASSAIVLAPPIWLLHTLIGANASTHGLSHASSVRIVSG